MTEIAKLFATIGADVSDFDKGMRGVKDQLSDVERGFKGVRDMVGTGLKVAAGIGVAAIGGLATGIGVAVTKAADMEQGIANIAASMQLGSDETAELKDLIMDLGLDPNLKVTAVEAAQAIEVLGTAGLTLDEILAGAAESTVLLANSTGADFALAGAVASDVMAQFNIEAKDMAMAVDQITGVTVASKFDINDYSLAIAQAGGMAGSVGVSFEDFNATIAATASRFASGSDAGTGFKTFMTTLVPKSKDAAAAMQELGLSTTNWEEAAGMLTNMLGKQVTPTVEGVYTAFNEYAAAAGLAEVGTDKMDKKYQDFIAGFSVNQFFDANGALKDMDQIAQLLQESFGGLTEAQKIETATTIFGTDAMRTAFGLMDAGAAGMQEFKNIIGNTSAEESAKIRMDTLTGSWEIFTGVLETLTLGIGDKFLPVAQELIEWATSLAQTYGPQLITWAENAVNAMGFFFDAIEQGWSVTDALSVAINMMFPSEWASKINGAIFLIDDIVDSISEFITEAQNILKPLTDWISENIKLNDVLAGIGTVLAAAFGPVVIGAISSFIAALTPVLALFVTAVAASAALRTAWQTDFLGIRTKTGEALTYLDDTFGGLLDTIQEFGGDALKEIVDWATGNKTQFTATQKIWDSAKTSFTTLFTDMGTKLTEWGTLAFTWFKEKFPEAAGKLTEAFDSVKAKFEKLWDVVKPLLDKAIELFNTFVTDWQNGSEGTSTALDKARMAMDGIFTIMITLVETSVNTMLNALTLVAQLLSGDWSGAWETAQTLVRDVLTGLDTMISTAFTTIGQALGFSKDDVKKWYDATKQNISDWWANFSAKIATRDWDGIYDDVMKFFSKTGITSWYNDTTKKFEDWWNKFKTWIKDRDWYQYGKDVVQGFWNGLKSLWTDFINWWNNAVGKVSNTLTNILGLFSPSKVFYEHGENIVKGLANGIRDSMPMAYNKMDELAAGLNNSFNMGEQNYAYAATMNTESNEEAALMRENNNLLRTLIQVLDGKEMSSNVTVSGDGRATLSSLVEFRAGLR